MRITNILEKTLFLSIFIIVSGCEPEPELDPCLATKWEQAKEYEIKLAVHISATNPNLPGGSAGSLKPEDFQSMVVSGTIEKVECSDSTSGPFNLGNSYIDRYVDYPAPIDISGSYWIGHVVYVVDFDNDKDYLDLNLAVKITMADGQSYICNYSHKVYSEEIVLVSGEMYFYVLPDVYSDLWIKV